MSPAIAQQILTRIDWMRMALGWGLVVGLLLVRPHLPDPLNAVALALLLILIIAIIAVCAFGVVHQAEALARRLGDPYGSLVLTLSIVLIEVILIAAVMLGPGEHATIARDSVMAVAMIILNLVVGLALLLGGRKFSSGLRHNRSGTSAYLTMLVVLISVGFFFPVLLGEQGAYRTHHAVIFAVATIAIYAVFLMRQMGVQATDFQEVPAPPRRTVIASSSAPDTPATSSILAVFLQHKREIMLRTGILIVTVVPIVLLAQQLAVFLNDGLGRIGAPTAFAGLLIALIVFLPESLTAIRAALAGELQRVINLCHGALVSTVGLTIPTVLVIGLFTSSPVHLAESPVNLFFLGASLLLSIATFTPQRVTAIPGLAHLFLFGCFAVALFS